MRAILIEPKFRRISEVNIDESKRTLDEWYRLIGCSMVEVAVYITEHDSILVDEEGLLKKGEKYYFNYNGSTQPFAGNGLITGCDEEGATVSCSISIEEVIKNIMFLDEDEILKYYYEWEKEEGVRAKGSFDGSSEA